MSSLPACPVCGLENTYPDGDQLVCADCGHEWQPAAAGAEAEPEATEVVVDANGQPLASGDTVVLVKDLKVKGSSITLKVGTRIKGIRLVGGDHPIDCKIDGGKFSLKPEFVKKS
jgi:protein PhnA